MNARMTLQDLRREGVSLKVDGDMLIVEKLTMEELRATLSEHKPCLLEMLRSEECVTANANDSGMIIRWSKCSVCLKLRDPTAGEWHQVRAAACPPSFAKAADTDRISKGRT